MTCSTLLKVVIALPALVVFMLGGLRYGVLPSVDRRHNGVRIPAPYHFSTETQRFHESAFVADLHADSFLWGRNLQRRGIRGQIDLPRMQEGGVDLQVFGVVTKVPRHPNYRKNRAESDSLPVLFLASWRSPKTWFNPKERALTQAREITDLATKSPLSLVLRRGDLSTEGIKGLIALEGMHALGDTEEALTEFYAAGFRMMGLAHLFDNQIAGSAHGITKHGLTPQGRSLIPQMEALGITIDLAHASPRSLEETLDLATKPVVVSHTGVTGTCPGSRNLTDPQLRGIAKNGGVIGIGYWQEAVCGQDIAAIIKAILHTVSVAGIDHVGLGSDFDGDITTPFDVTGLPMLTEALLAADLSPEAVAKIVGGNVKRVLLANLPE